MSRIINNNNRTALICCYFTVDYPKQFIDVMGIEY